LGDGDFCQTEDYDSKRFLRESTAETATDGKEERGDLSVLIPRGEKEREKEKWGDAALGPVIGGPGDGGTAPLTSFKKAI